MLAGQKPPQFPSALPHLRGSRRLRLRSASSGPDARAATRSAASCSRSAVKNTAERRWGGSKSRILRAAAWQPASEPCSSCISISGSSAVSGEHLAERSPLAQGEPVGPMWRHGSNCFCPGERPTIPGDMFLRFFGLHFHLRSMLRLFNMGHVQQ